MEHGASRPTRRKQRPFRQADTRSDSVAGEETVSPHRPGGPCFRARGDADNRVLRHQDEDRDPRAEPATPPAQNLRPPRAENSPPPRSRGKSSGYGRAPLSDRFPRPQNSGECSARVDVEQVEKCTRAGKIAGIDRHLRGNANSLVEAHRRGSRDLTSPIVALRRPIRVVFAMFDDDRHVRSRRFDSLRLHRIRRFARSPPSRWRHVGSMSLRRRAPAARARRCCAACQRLRSSKSGSRPR